MRVLVTGSCGFIGAHLVRLLAGKGNEVWGYDIGSYAAASWSDVEALIGDRLIKGDVCDETQVHAAIERARPDVVYHLAAESHVDASLLHPAKAMRVNAVGTQVVGSVCAKHDIPLVYCSTDEVYGDAWGHSRPHKESAPLRPSSPYSAGKASGEMALWALARSFGLRAVITRGCNAYGPGQYPEKLVPIACRLLQQGKQVPLHGGGHQVRQWIHVEDFAEGLEHAANYLTQGDMRTGEVVPTFNLAGPRRMSVLALVRLLAQRAGRTDKAWAKAGDRPGQDMAYWVCHEKTERVLGWRPQRRIDVDAPELLKAYPADGEVRTSWTT